MNDDMPVSKKLWNEVHGKHVPCDDCSSFDFSCTATASHKPPNCTFGVKDMKLRADLVLEDMAKLFRERNIKYGDNWEKVGHLFVTLFPDGLTLKTYDDFVKFHFMSWIIGKFSRWVNNGLDGSDDSLRDATVYMAMFQAFSTMVEKDDESKGNGKPVVSRKTESTSREQAMADTTLGGNDRRQ